MAKFASMKKFINQKEVDLLLNRLVNLAKLMSYSKDFIEWMLWNFRFV